MRPVSSSVTCRGIFSRSHHRPAPPAAPSPQVGPPRAGSSSSLDPELLEAEAAALLELTQRPGDPFRLPVPKSPFQDKLG